jgi:hypothetical protein
MENRPCIIREWWGELTRVRVEGEKRAILILILLGIDSHGCRGLVSL